jgi:hypothetical protein
MVCSTLRPHFTPGKDPVPILQEAGWAPGPVWTGAENLVPTGNIALYSMKIGNLKQIQQGNCFETFHNLNTTEQQCSNKKKKMIRMKEQEIQTFRIKTDTLASRLK